MKNILKPTLGMQVATAATSSLLLAASPPAWAQSTAGTCEIALGYAAVALSPVGTPAAVPGLTLLGVGVLGVLFAAIAWRGRQKSGLNRLMSVTLMASGAVLSVAGSDSLLNVVRAAGPYEFTSSTGGSISDAQVPYADPAPVLTVTNTSGGRIKITSNGNASETGTCTVNAELAPGASCTTQAFACTPPPPVIQQIEVQSLPAQDCDYGTVIGSYDMGGINSVTAYLPLLVTPPTFDVSSVTVTSAYTRNATQAIFGPGGSIPNANDLITGTLSVTATAPTGYGFGVSLADSFTWGLPYTCGTIAVKPQLPEEP
ncbi:hypothetical protein HNP33_003310 [Comamonas odontotermitis]|uniref:Midcut-by-XrtH protein n=1 Tax=Comamonas odontotermitis TaxID=379895 RepID=A0ABR6RJ47_9BURK|nr:midcut-by-XrtH protein [Comamonas odontotermitis]MBB6579200.1 hypothetical protein [Comamonas odontotermitis]